MGKADYYLSGSYNFICDQCGKKFKAKDMKKQWDGLEVCPRCFDYRNPQDFVRGKQDNQTVPVNRPDATPAFTDEATSLTVTE
jgi:ribosome-binding protein aMBF1 (putative translation factor)